MSSISIAQDSEEVLVSVSKVEESISVTITETRQPVNVSVSDSGDQVAVTVTEDVNQISLSVSELGDRVSVIVNEESETVNVEVTEVTNETNDLKGPSFTYENDNLTRVDYDDGSFKTLTYASGRLSQISINRNNIIVTKTLFYDATGRLTEIVES